jgi:F-type H+-transporting ATPase subunit delta
MAELSTLARPYAKAVFDLAREEKQFPDWSALLGALAVAVRDPAVAPWIGHPALGRAQLADVLVEALGKGASDREQNLVRLLAENGRLALAPAIAQQFEALRAEAENRVNVEITSAAPVDTAQQKALAEAIGRRLQREVNVEWKTDPELIAGAVVRAGDLVIDGSFTAELDQLRRVLTQ